MFVDIHIEFADICMSDIHLKGNYMSGLCSLCAPQWKQFENLQTNLGKIS